MAWSSVDLETLESHVSSGKSASAKDCSSTCCALQAKRSSSTLCQWQAIASDTEALGRDSWLHRGGTWGDFCENARNSIHIVSYLQSKGDPLSALASVGDPYGAPSGGPSSQVRQGPGKIGACVCKTHLEEDRNESTARFGRDLLHR